MAKNERLEPILDEQKSIKEVSMHSGEYLSATQPPL
jgi:hypothetical protein